MLEENINHQFNFFIFIILLLTWINAKKTQKYNIVLKITKLRLKTMHCFCQAVWRSLCARFVDNLLFSLAKDEGKDKDSQWAI